MIMALEIMNYALTERYPSETLKSYYPCTVQGDGTVVPDVTDPDEGSVAILLEPVSPDGVGVAGSVLALLPSGVRVVPSVSLGVWVTGG